METVIRVKVSELNAGFLKTIKSLFKNERKVEIVIHPAPEEDETSYLLSTPANRKSLEKSLSEARSGKVVKVNLEKLK